jgi:hypothetical protein
MNVAIGARTLERVDLEANMRYKISYNYCGICGRVPKTELDEPNRAPIRYWDCDDGWRIGTLCRWCHEEYGNARPKPGDFAYETTNGIADDINTDEDPLEAF